MPARSSPKPTKTGRVKRSEEARKRRRAKERDRQRRGNEECAKLDRQLGDLERWAANVRRDWNVTDTTGLTDGTARPGLCPWGIPEGPPTKIQQSLREVLGKVIDELEDSEAGRFVSRWVKLPREQQAGFEWAAVEKAVEKSAERVRSEWCSLLGCESRVARSGSPLRPPLLRALSRVFLEGNCEDDSIIDEIDFGVNIGVREKVEPSGIWVPYSASQIPGHPISLFERDTFRNYESARALPGEVKRELERSVERGHMVKLAEGEEPPPGAIISKIALVEKPNRIPRAFRLINDMRRSGLNDLVTSQGNLTETVALPGLRSVGQLLRCALESYGDSVRIIEVDAKDAFRHLSVAREDVEFLFVAIERNGCEGRDQSNETGQKFDYYYHVRLPFGLVSSPYLWVRAYSLCHRIKRAILSLLCVLYVDDGSWASCDATCLKDFLAVIVLSKVMEVLLELAKARVSNSPRTLGFQWDLHTGKLSVPDEKLELIGGQGDYVLRKAGAGQAVELNVVESLLGRLTWATQCFTRYRCHLAPIFAWLKAVKSKRNAVSQAPLRSAFLGSNVCDKIRLLLGLLRSEQVRAFSLPEIIGRSVEAEWAASGSTIITDASLEGLGGTVCSVSKGRTLRLWFALNLRQSGDMALRQLMGDTFVSGDISRLELLAIVLGLLIVGEIQDESGGECTILSDNTAAIHVVNKGSSSVPRMAELWARLVACRRVGRQVRAFHVPGVSNEISDGLSRGVRPRQRVARALGRRVPVSKFIERLLGASVGELPAYFTVSEEEELLGG